MTASTASLRLATVIALAAAASSAIAQGGNVTAPQIPSFPGAEGYGGLTPGGRGGKVFLVTTLADSGPGSLRAAIEAEGPRIVVFRVGGIIELKSELRIQNPRITIAGQSAPGDGICLKGYALEIATSDVIIRHLRVRLGDDSGLATDAISARGQKNIILDHLSASWSIDETVSVYHCENVTIQWCLISESLFGSHHGKGHHGFGGIWGSNNSTHHHNLFAHHSSRTPRFASGSGNTDFRNNVIYNWGYNNTYGGEKRQNDRFNSSTINVVANYYKPGPATATDVAHRIVNPSTRKLDQDFGRWHVSGNVVVGNEKVSADNWDGGVQIREDAKYLAEIRLPEPWPALPIKPQTAGQAYNSVLAHVGASLPKRDAIDTRLIEETRTGTATFEGPRYRENRKLTTDAKTGIIDSQANVGGWGDFKGADAPPDTDLDGMPDAWESRHGLDPKNRADNSSDNDNDGYTNIEEYLNNTDPTVFIDYTKPENNVFSF